jgi:hypothetical protein
MYAALIALFLPLFSYILSIIIILLNKAIQK